jgi:hypothetical protein
VFRTYGTPQPVGLAESRCNLSKPIYSLEPLNTPTGQVISTHLRMLTAAELFSGVLEHAQETLKRLTRYVPIGNEHSVYRNAGTATKQSRALARTAVESLALLMQQRCGVDSDPACRIVQHAALSRDGNLAVTALWHSVDRLAEWFTEHLDAADLPSVMRDDFAKGVELFAAALAPEPELTPTDARNKFCYEQWQRGQTYKEIWAALKLHPEWEQVSDPKAVRGPIKAWAAKHGLDIREGQPGKPKRAK